MPSVFVFNDQGDYAHCAEGECHICGHYGWHAHTAPEIDRICRAEAERFFTRHEAESKNT